MLADGRTVHALGIMPLSLILGIILNIITPIIMLNMVEVEVEGGIIIEEATPDIHLPMIITRCIQEEEEEGGEGGGIITNMQ
jgi:hypothetical protein